MSELRADCGCSGLDEVAPGDDDDKEQNDDADEGEGEWFVTSCSCCADKDTLDFKSLRNQPETRKTNCTYF